MRGVESGDGEAALKGLEPCVLLVQVVDCEGDGLEVAGEDGEAEALATGDLGHADGELGGKELVVRRLAQLVGVQRESLLREHCEAPLEALQLQLPQPAAAHPLVALRVQGLGARLVLEVHHGEQLGAALVGPKDGRRRG